MNFNLDLKVDKAMNKLSESKTLRVWTYIICCVFFVWNNYMESRFNTNCNRQNIRST